jgi:cell fate regulator YaaT (PSP1 superfamily)
MSERDFLVSIGNTGDFSRFRSTGPTDYARGDAVIVRGSRGLQMGHIMCATRVEHDSFLSKAPAGHILRRATREDLEQARAIESLCERIYADGRQTTLNMNLPLEIIDVEATLDGNQAIVSYVRAAECDYRPLVSSLSTKHDILLIMQNLTLPMPEIEGCGRPDCGHGGGGCDTCSSGGCSTGGCASGAKKEDIAALLSQFGTAAPFSPRTPLL